jgi:hypothetical protein
MAGPSNETEAEALERRKVEALEKIAEALATLAGTVMETDLGHVCIRVKDS